MVPHQESVPALQEDSFTPGFILPASGGGGGGAKWEAWPFQQTHPSTHPHQKNVPQRKDETCFVFGFNLGKLAKPPYQTVLERILGIRNQSFPVPQLSVVVDMIGLCAVCDGPFWKSGPVILT